MKFDVSGTEINYYFTCKTQLWFFAHHINMEDNSHLVIEGRNTHEFAYQSRAEAGKEFSIDRIKIDFFDRKQKIVHEVKHSKKKSQAHVWQLKYYLFVLRESNFGDVTGVLEYPHVKLREEIFLNNNDVEILQDAVAAIREIKQQKIPPAVVQHRHCKKCSYYDLCYAGEPKEEQD